jgi:hypothetical protein
VVSGYHRVTAARELEMPSISSIVVEATTDAEYTLLAVKGNLRHGLPMSTDEQRAAVQRLRALGLSEGEIARQTGIPKGTVHNWLTKRDTNAGRPVRTHLADGEGHKDPEADGGWHVAPTARPEARVLAEVSATLADFLAGTPTDKIEPADVLAWVGTLAPDQRRSLDADVSQAIMWLTNLHAALSAPTLEEVAS